MAEVFRGNSLNEIGPVYFNIPANTGESSQGGAAAPTQSQQPNGQKTNFGTTENIPASATKIAPSHMKLRRDADPSAYGQGG